MEVEHRKNTETEHRKDDRKRPHSPEHDVKKEEKKRPRSRSPERKHKKRDRERYLCPRMNDSLLAFLNALYQNSNVAW